MVDKLITACADTAISLQNPLKWVYQVAGFGEVITPFRDAVKEDLKGVNPNIPSIFGIIDDQMLVKHELHFLNILDQARQSSTWRC